MLEEMKAQKKFKMKTTKIAVVSSIYTHQEELNMSNFFHYICEVYTVIILVNK